MDLRNLADANAALDNMRQNMAMKALAKEILCEENYERSIKSYKFTFWFQLLGILCGFLVPTVILVRVYKDVMFITFGAAIGIIWMILWLVISQLIPQTKLYRKFARWYRKENSSLQELDLIFYE